MRYWTTIASRSYAYRVSASAHSRTGVVEQGRPYLVRMKIFGSNY